jgi:dolichyl-phosphate-mannose-protein mannosyltransferase
MRGRLFVTACALFVCSLALFLYRIGTPPSYIFDEGVYVRGAREFLNSSVDSVRQHPPLGKLMIAGGMRLLGDTPAGWRLAGAICGSVTLVAIFLWGYLLLGNIELALTAAILTLLNNFLYVMSRVAMLDVFYFMFVMLGILTFTLAVMVRDLRPIGRRVLMLSTGVMLGAGAACKWNAVVFLGCIAVISAYLYWRNSCKAPEIGIATLVGALSIVPVLIYCVCFLPLFADIGIQFSLRALAAENRFIWQWHRAAAGNPALNVRWYEWFFRSSPERGLSYLMGNFVVMWLGVPAVLYCAWRALKERTGALAEILIVTLYSANIIQWLVIPQKSTCYYYYYPSAMVLGIAILLAIKNAKLLRIGPVHTNIILMLTATIFFLYCYQKMAVLPAPFDCALGCWP